SERYGQSKSWPPEHGHSRALQPLLAVELLVANDGWVPGPVKAVSRRRRGPQASLYRTCHPAILGHRGRRLATAQPGVSKPGRSTDEPDDNAVLIGKGWWLSK